MLHDGSTTHVRPIRPQRRRRAPGVPRRPVRAVDLPAVLRPARTAARARPRSGWSTSTTSTASRSSRVERADRRRRADHRRRPLRPDRRPTRPRSRSTSPTPTRAAASGSVLLEHLAAAARERGVRRFVAEVLPQNGRMIAVFREAGYEVRQRTEDGIVAVGFDIDPTDRSLAVMADREHRAEARSMRGLLHAARSCVVGPGADARRDRSPAGSPRACWTTCARATRRSSCTRSACPAGRASPTLRAGRDVPGPVELAVVAVPAADDVLDVVRDLARLGRAGRRAAHGRLRRDRAPTGSSGSARCSAPRTARACAWSARARTGSSQRATRPCSSTRRSRRTPPAPGRIGLFCQSGAAGRRAARRGPAPRARPVAVRLRRAPRRRLRQRPHAVLGRRRRHRRGRAVPGVAGQPAQVLPGRPAAVADQAGDRRDRRAARARWCRPATPSGRRTPRRRTLEEMLRQSGVHPRARTPHQLLDVAAGARPPAAARPGRRVAILAQLRRRSPRWSPRPPRRGLVVSGHVQLLPEDAAPDAGPGGRRRALRRPRQRRRRRGRRIPTVGGPDAVLQEAVAQAAARSGRPPWRCILDLHGLTAASSTRRRRRRPAVDRARLQHARGRRAGPGPRRPLRAWRAGDRGPPAAPGRARTPGGPRAWSPAGSPPRRPATAARARRRPDRASCSPRSASACCRRTVCTTPTRPSRPPSGSAGPVALKTTVAALRHRADLGGVRLDVADEAELRADVAQVLALAQPARGRTATRRSRCRPWRRTGPRAWSARWRTRCSARSSASGSAGDASDLLGDVAYGVPPLTDVDVAELIRTAAGGAAAVRLPRPARARRRRARGRHRPGRGARRRPARAALARAQPGGRLRARRGRPRRAGAVVPRGPGRRHPTAVGV